MFQPGAMLYTQSFGSRPENVEVPHIDTRNPAGTDNIYPIGKRWINTSNNTDWVLTSYSSANAILVANWLETTNSGSGTFTTLTVTGQSTLGPLTVVGTTNINTTGTAVTTIGNTTGGTAIVGPMSVSGPSTLSSTLAVTGLSTLTGGINTAPVVVPAGASPQTANARSGQVTFSGVSIAGGATQSFVINNSSISAIGTVILYSMVGATTGSALNIQSVTNVAGVSSTIVVENGSATTSSANITFTFIVLN
jgi:hypothetical protein